MSPEVRPTEKTFDFPVMPIWGLDVGKELGSIDARLNQLENDNREMKRDIKNVDDRVDKCLVAINRLDERTQNLESKFNISIGLTGAVLAAVIAGLILQYLK